VRPRVSRCHRLVHHALSFLVGKSAYDFPSGKVKRPGEVTCGPGDDHLLGQSVAVRDLESRRALPTSGHALSQPVLLLVVIGIVGAACSSGSQRSTPSSTTRQPAALVNLVPASAELRGQCAAAANRLRFAVPCPTQVPARAGMGMSCPRPQGAALGPCLGLEGAPPYPVFGLDLSGFDVPADYVGVDGKALGHLVVEARPHVDSPPNPCVGGTVLGNVALGLWTPTELTCPNAGVMVQREAMHGEGAHAGHLLFEWNQDGIEYIASAHGPTRVNRELLRQVVTSMTLIGPGTS
jgi:hypothetical protein